MNLRTKNLIRYVVPTTLSSCCFFLFTIIDGIFVGQGVGTDALGAVNIALPFMMLINAALMLMTIGGVTVVAIRFGRGDREGANQAFMHAFLGTAVLSAALSAVGVFFTGPLCTLLGANETYFDMVRDYLRWYSVFIIPSGISTLLQGVCRNDGAPVLVSVAVIIGTAANIFGDWLLIFPLRMGVAGAAIATGVSQSLTLFIVLGRMLGRKGKLSFCAVRPSAALFRKIAGRGLPEMVAQLATPVTTLCMNYVLISRVGNTAVNAFSIISYVASFSMAVFYGTSEGLQPLFGQSYGAKKEDDLGYYFRMGTVINVLGSVVIFILLLFFGGAVCKLFGADAEAYGVTVAAMPKFSWSFIVVALNTMISAYLYSTKRTREAVLLNVCRGLAFNSLVITVLPALFGGGVVWYTAGIAESLSLVVAFALWKRSEKDGIVFR